ncbi:hypothetical protein ACE1SV_00500 [Streptomyces sp. E-15]
MSSRALLALAGLNKTGDEEGQDRGPGRQSQRNAVKSRVGQWSPSSGRVYENFSVRTVMRKPAAVKASITARADLRRNVIGKDCPLNVHSK